MPRKMARLKQWCADATAASAEDDGVTYRFKMAEACGVAALRTANPDELATSVRRAVASGRSLVVAVPVNYEDYRLLF